MQKYISPGAWFSIEYPSDWHEFEDTEESFLFYNPDKWNGNFRISAYIGENKGYAQYCMDEELKHVDGRELPRERSVVYYPHLDYRSRCSFGRMFFYSS